MKKQTIIMILFIGSIWGILEATLGYVLQFLPPLISGSVMFPIGAILMIYAYKNTDDVKSIFLVAFIAATIKSVNLLLPGLPPIKTYNPMIAIMLQAFSLFLVLKIVDQKNVLYQATSILFVSIFWRVLFYINISMNHALTQFNFPQLASNQATYQFLIPYGLMGALVLFIFYGLVRVFHKDFKLNFKLNPYVSFALFVFALMMSYFL